MHDFFNLLNTSLIFKYLCNLLFGVYNSYDSSFYPQLLRAYDFIVIGGGSAGAVVANRLSENPDWKVLLIEAGGDENEISDIPSLAGYLQLSDLDWKYKTEPPTGDSAYCLAMVGDRCNWPRGKVLGELFHNKTLLSSNTSVQYKC